jgi:hypothetical protein
VGEKTKWEYLALYHDFFHLHEFDKKILPITCSSRRLTSFLVLEENVRHDSRSQRSNGHDAGSAGSPLHLVQGTHEKAAHRERTIYPLHMPQVHLPTYDETRIQGADF